jgi:hypothetical protein
MRKFGTVDDWEDFVDKRCKPLYDVLNSPMTSVNRQLTWVLHSSRGEELEIARERHFQITDSGGN